MEVHFGACLNFRRPPVQLRTAKVSEIDNVSVKRVRIWRKDMFNLYPSDVNSGKQGEDLHRLHSCEEINIDITSTVVSEEDLIKSGRKINDDELLDMIFVKISDYIALYHPEDLTFK